MNAASTSASMARAVISGMFAVNAVPHGVSGVQGRSFRSPFGTPPGVGESSAVSNIAWSAINAAAAAAVGAGTLRTVTGRIAFGVGATVGAFLIGGYFQRQDQAPGS